MIEAYEPGSEWLLAASCPAIALPVNAVTVNTSLMTGRCLLVGWALHAVGGPGGFQIRDGGDASGLLVADQNLAAGGSQEAGPSMPGIRMDSGVFLVLATITSLSGAVWVVPLSYRGRRDHGQVNDHDLERQGHGA